MTTSTPGDHYAALGVAKDATATAIKTAYRKLVLKHHPDKVDDIDKTAAADRFHKIQTAWEVLGEDEKRSRYDAHCRLASLKREKELAEKDRFTTPQFRTPSYRNDNLSRHRPHSPSSPRSGPPRSYSYVEVKPPFDADNLDRIRTSERREFDHEHDRPRRTPVKDERQRTRLTRQDSKESERARYREKGRQATKATNRDRDMKYSYSRPEVSTDSESDNYFEKRSPRDLREEERAREQYLERARQQAEEARSNSYMDERTQKLFADAQDYQQRMRSSRGHAEARRPSPTRTSSSREHLDYARTADGRPATVRRGSHKPRVSSRDDVDVLRQSRRGSDRESYRSSNEYDDAAPRRPPTLNQTKSAPNDIRIPLEKQRSNSVQYQASVAEDFIPPPVRRADSMPHAVSKERNKPVRSSTLRQAQTTGDYDTRPSPPRAYSSKSPKASYDEADNASRDPYRTEVREPTGRRLTRSPSPLRAGDKSRSASNRHAAQAPHLPRTSSTTYTYPMQTGADILTSRPKLSRGDSGRKDSYLFGEVPTTRSSRDRDTYSTAPPENVRVREIRPDVKVASGYTATRRGSESRSPSYYNQDNYNSPPVSA